jgi:hypothetical protein
MDPVPTLKIQIASKEEWLQWYRVFLYIVVPIFRCAISQGSARAAVDISAMRRCGREGGLSEVGGSALGPAVACKPVAPVRRGPRAECHL